VDKFGQTEVQISRKQQEYAGMGGAHSESGIQAWNVGLKDGSG
jgi:hypothetical protein